MCLWEEIENGSSRKRTTACFLRCREGMNWINVAWNRDKCRGFVKYLMNTGVSCNTKECDEELSYG